MNKVYFPLTDFLRKSLLFLLFSLLAHSASSLPGSAEEAKENKKGSPTTSQSTKARSKNAADRQAKRLMDGVKQLLQQAATERRKADKLPSRKDYFVAVPPWAETKEDRARVVRQILDSALQIVTDGPIVEYQTKIKKRQSTVRTLRNQIADLRERKLDAPQNSLMPFTETVSSIEAKIKELQVKISENEKDVIKIKGDIRQLFKDKNIEMSDSQLDLLLGSVLSGDIVKLVAAFEAARLIDKRLGQLMAQNNESLVAARRYFSMHAALFAMLLHAQNEIIEKIDNVYLAKLRVILDDLRKARRKTARLLRGQNRSDQRRTLLANRKAQDFSEQVAVFYRDYLITQRHKIIESRHRTVRDLSIADNTYETVEATFQLRSLIEDAKSSFQALERLEAPGFGQVFKNDELRKEFEKLTDKLAVPSS